MTSSFARSNARNTARQRKKSSAAKSLLIPASSHSTLSRSTLFSIDEDHIGLDDDDIESFGQDSDAYSISSTESIEIEKPPDSPPRSVPRLISEDSSDGRSIRSERSTGSKRSKQSTQRNKPKERNTESKHDNASKRSTRSTPIFGRNGSTQSTRSTRSSHSTRTQKLSTRSKSPKRGVSRSKSLPVSSPFQKKVDSLKNKDRSTHSKRSIRSVAITTISVPKEPKRGVARSKSLPVSKNECKLFVPPTDVQLAMKEKKDRRRKRESQTAAGAVGGMVAGGLVLGPVGVVVGAAVGGIASRQIAKKVDKRSQRKREQEAFRQFASSKATKWTQNGDAAVFV